MNIPMKNKISSVNFEWNLERIQNFAQHGSATSKKTKTTDTNKKVNSPSPQAHQYQHPPSLISPPLDSVPASFS